MGFRVNTNVDALKAYQQLANANKMTAKAQLRMASGKRILSVADDTSGFNIGTSLKGKVAVMKGAQGNIASAKNLLSTAEGGLLSINDLITQIEGKLSDATNPTTDRTSLAADINALANEISSIFSNTKFNNTNLLSGSASQGGFNFQVGEAGDTLNLNFAGSIASSGGAGQSTSVAGQIGSFTSTAVTSAASLASSSVVSSLNTTVTNLKNTVTSALGNIGNFSQRLDIKDDTLNVAITNAQSSISRLFDADMAAEQLNATKGTILQQSATAMFSQLNFAPQQVLQLFG
jgi:flagellin